MCGRVCCVWRKLAELGNRQEKMTDQKEVQARYTRGNTETQTQRNEHKHRVTHANANRKVSEAPGRIVGIKAKQP